MKTLAEARAGECRFCERSADEVVDKGGAMVTTTRCNRQDCMWAFEQETRRELALQGRRRGKVGRRAWA